MASKAKTRTKSDEAYLLIRSKVRSGEFEPGERLVETKLAELLGMGRAPVREAILRLESEGMLVGRGTYGGKYVSYLEDESVEIIVWRYEIRAVIEGLAARLAALNMTGRQIQELRELANQAADAFDRHDRETRLQAGIAFHSFLVANCGNPLLYQVWESCHLVPVTPRSEISEEELFANMPEGGTDFRRQLLAVVDAVSSHDGDVAEHAVRRGILEVAGAIQKTTMKAKRELGR